MGDRTLALFDCAGIQDYLFTTSRLQESVGASELVERATRQCVAETLLAVLPNALVEWDTGDLNPEAPAEVVYQGGGNAAVVFRDRADGERVLSRWSELLLREAPGLIPVAVLTPWKGQFHEVLGHAHLKLGELKGRRAPSARLEGIGISSSCTSTGRAATVRYREPGERKRVAWLSEESACKRHAVDWANRRLRDSFGDQSEYRFPLDFDKLGGVEGESHLAVVHADGNGIGQRFQDKAREGVPALRRLSKRVSEAGISALRNVILTLREMQKQGGLRRFGIPDLEDDNGRPLLPLRPLVYGGDDLTLVCDGRLGLGIAVEYIRHFVTHPFWQESGQDPVGVCAGVSIVRSHFPFNRAYDLAEEAIGFAKDARRKAKTAGLMESSWLDFHIALSGITDTVEDMRESDYVSGDGNPLCWRPWRVCPSDAGHDHDWDHFTAGIEEFRAERWARSRAKLLRSALHDGATATKFALAAARSRGCAPRAVPGVTPDSGWTSTPPVMRTPYFDMLDALDFWIPLTLGKP